MGDILGPEWFPKTPQERARLYEQHIVGTRHTNWSLLTNAARSSLVQGIKGCGELLNIWTRAEDRGQARAETEFVLQLNYSSFAVGPLLGAILSSVLAIESFQRLYVELFLEQTDNEAERRDELARFDGLSFVRRLEYVREVARAPVITGPLSDTLEALINFRNDCAHDSPISFFAEGEMKRMKRGRSVAHEPDVRYRGLFPVLYDDPIPLSPSHAWRAAEAHDEFCWHILDRGNQRTSERIERIGSRALFRITSMPGVKRDQIDAVMKGWDQDLAAWRESITPDEEEEFYRELVRRVNVKVVPESED